MGHKYIEVEGHHVCLTITSVDEGAGQCEFQGTPCRERRIVQYIEWDATKYTEDINKQIQNYIDLNF